MSDDKEILVYIMPWADLKYEVKIGKTRFLPWDKNRVKDGVIGELVQE